MSSKEPRRQSHYTPDEVEEILNRAASRRAPGSVSHARLLEMAEELGVEPHEVEATIAEVQEEREDKEFRREFLAERRSSLWPHLLPFLFVSLFLIWLNARTSYFPWAIFPVFGWGMGVFAHMAEVLPTGGARFEAQYAEWKEKKRRKREPRRPRRTTAATATDEAADAPVEAQATVEQKDEDTSEAVADTTYPKPAAAERATEEQDAVQKVGRKKG